MGLNLTYIEGQAPIDRDEREGLLIKTISTREELNEFEQLNIEKAIEWTLIKKFKLEDILTRDFILKVHKQMFGEVWKWAGKLRKTNINLGVDKYKIDKEIHKLIDDCKYWVENNTLNDDEKVIRFKHRLVSIHLFPNGNGRHSRLFADIFISHGFGKKIFSWGSGNITETGEIRSQYLNAIRQADKKNYKQLLKLARA